MTPLKALSWESILDGEATQVVYSCDHCQHYSIATAPGRSGHSTDAGVNDLYVEGELDTEWLPKIGDAVNYSDVPELIASAASEAHECASIGARRAAILMARSVIEAAAKDKGVNSGTLYQKIEALAERGVVRPLIAEAAHGIRDFGNDMAHGDFTTEVTEQDVGETLDLMAVVLSEVFQVDAKTKSLRARAAARKGGATAQTD